MNGNIILNASIESLLSSKYFSKVAIKLLAVSLEKPL